MGIFLSKVHDQHNASNHMEFVMDADEDVTSLPGMETCAPGSKATSIESGREYRLTTDGTWSALPKGGGEARLQNLSVTENGTYTPTAGYDGFDEVDVTVPGAALTYLDVTANGTYTPAAGYDGFDVVSVNVPEASLESINVRSNGTYLPDEGYDGFNVVYVDVPEASLESLNVTSNGTYTPGEGYDGFDTVVVDVEASVTLDDLLVTSNGQYRPSAGYDGFSLVAVEVPTWKLDDYQSNPQQSLRVTPQIGIVIVTVNTGSGTVHSDIYTSFGIQTNDAVSYNATDNYLDITAQTGYLIIGTVTLYD